MPAPIRAALRPHQWQLCSCRNPESGTFTVKVALGDEEKKAEVEKEQGLRKDWFPTMGQFLSLRATDSLAIELARGKNYKNSELVSTKSAYWVVTVKVPEDKVQSWREEYQAYVFPWGFRYGGQFFDLKGLEYIHIYIYIYAVVYSSSSSSSSSFLLFFFFFVFFFLLQDDTSIMSH